MLELDGLLDRWVSSDILAQMDNRLKKRCMVCAKVALLSGGVCQPCNEKIRAQAQGVQRGIRDSSDRELYKHGVKPEK